MADGLARQIAGLTGDIRNLGKRIPSYQRGVVANVSPPTVIMDRDVTATPRPVADVLVPGLAVGQRVEVRVIGSRRVITSIHPADNEIYVDTGWFTVPVRSVWNSLGPSPVSCRKIGRQVFWRGRVQLTAAQSGTSNVVNAGGVPVWARPADVYDTMKPVTANFASATAENALKSAAVYDDGRLAVFMGASSSDPISLAGLSGYLVD